MKNLQLKAEKEALEKEIIDIGKENNIKEETIAAVKSETTVLQEKLKDLREDVSAEHDNIQHKLFKVKTTEIELERKLYLQRFKLAKDLLEIRKKEISEEKYCSCKGICRIYHFKHNWKKSISKEISDKFKLVKACNHCDKTSSNEDSVEGHIHSTHNQNISNMKEEEQNGGNLVRNTSIPSGGRLL